ncbi:type I-E CRISPR-associated protein Cse1/CasA [Nocardiopsis changdeensis]|uniref:Type I-E CRISPR-associated protein Cse1/CasA n=1 Tax=Nocardiopsis changdeensis TaxID=2831969 RepID=A0A975KTZ2_9ACTN|nr:MULTISPECIES: type I-E CRISPR-associated protein Cse1/CasA [Nocardiopsis]QUX26512.1 type I-E CRISPR-associated protein Cse1/CasA [Nocardiopsis changdeensis]QYX40784.1 type I-E CRISPR-associated protein Cse1/CasA [Nocardiopsis sp. MT53]
MPDLGLNLFRDPWIPVVYADGTRTEVGVRTALADADRIAALAAENPTVDIALYRLLLAVAHRLAGPVDSRHWPALWESGLPLEDLEEIGRGRWELLPADGEPGFAQDPVQRPEPAPVASLTALADRGAGAGFLWRMPPELSLSEAARWLLWCHAWDTGGIRAAHERGIDRGVPVGPAAALPHTRLVGTPLAQTLLLNLAPGPQGPAGQGWWERTTPVAGRRRGRTPEGMVDLLCWPARRIRLLPDADGLVRRVYITGGDDLRVPGDPAHGADQCFQDAYRLVLPRSLEATVPGLVAPAKSRTTPPSTPTVIDWFADRHHVLDRVQVETTTLATDRHRSVIYDIHDRTWTLPAAALVPGTAAHARLARVRDMVALADSAVRAAATATVPSRAARAKERVADLVARARHEWSGDLAPELADLDTDAGMEQCREALADVVARHVDRADRRLRSNPGRLAEGAPALSKARALSHRLSQPGPAEPAEAAL